MKTEVLKGNDQGSLVYAFEILTSGGLVAFPTDTVYGLAALAFMGKPIQEIYSVKERPPEKAIPILLGDLADLDKVARRVPSIARKLSARFWPGPLTLIVPKRTTLPEIVSATDTIGVRIPDHPIARALLHLSGPLAVTSANLSGQASPTNPNEVLGQIGGRIPLILDGGQTPGGIPSTVVNCLGREPRIVREGPISLEQIRLALRSDSPE